MQARDKGMRIRSLELSNIRSVAEGKVTFPGHMVIIGGNSVGKSTTCEALDLLLGPERLSRSSPIDEHDFFERRYLDENGDPIPIKLEVVLTDLTDDVLTKFRTHREYWNTATNELLDETATPEDVDNDDVVPALRIKFEGVYDVEEDEFRAETYFASPPPDDETRRARVSRAAKRRFGFIYLRALQTGSRSLSLERGSLLDVILRLKDDDRSAMWEQTLESVRRAPSPPPRARTAPSAWRTCPREVACEPPYADQGANTSIATVAAIRRRTPRVNCQRRGSKNIKRCSLRERLVAN